MLQATRLLPVQSLDVMSLSHPAGPSHEVVLDYTSVAGPTATHMRGTLLVNSHESMRNLGLYDRYVAALPERHREPILYAIAASWIPMDVAFAHYETCERLDLADAHLEQLGKLMAARVADTFLSSAIRATRKAGIAGMWLALAQNDRLWDRMYQGGGVCVWKTGPKDLIHESHGLPLITLRYWRTAYLHYITAFTKLFTNVAYLKPVRASSTDPHRIAIAISWV
jgi:hypothetical protein